MRLLSTTTLVVYIVYFFKGRLREWGIPHHHYLSLLKLRRKVVKKLIGSMLVLAALIAFPAYSAVNINTATQSELEAVKGVGPAKAKAIISYRESKGGFKSLDELDNVKGFGKASIEKLKVDLVVQPAKAK